MFFSKDLLKKIAIPLTILIFFGTLYIVWKLLDLPTDEELIGIARVYFERYGLITVLVSAALEAMLMLGLYYPGGLVIFLGVVFANGDILRIAEVIIVTTVGMLIAYSLNFFLGYHGWYHLLIKFGLEDSLERAKTKLETHNTKAILGSYWHPNFAAFISTAAGILHLNFYKFFLTSLIASICWNVFWGTIAALIGEASLAGTTVRSIQIIVVVWLAYILWQHHKTKLS